MPRDATETRDRLFREAERLFARRGVWQVTVREITTAAGQRNPSVVHYHFGSMEGLQTAILDRHGVELDRHRGELLAAAGPAPSSRDLIDALLVPYSACLLTESGCDYLQIVAQLSSQYSDWDRSGPAAPQLRSILRALMARMHGLSDPAAAERIVAIITVIGGTFAERARRLGTRRPPVLTHEQFLANLADMLVAIVEAPVSALAGSSEKTA